MEFCKNCGIELSEGVQFCTNCGAPVISQPQQEEQQPQQEVQQFQQEVQQIQPQPYQQPAQPQYTQAAPAQSANAPTPKTILILGIIGLAISWMPFGSIAGIIVSAIGMGKSNAYVKAGGVRCGMSVTGRILSRVGLILSIVMTVFWAIWFAVIIIGLATASSYNYSGYHYYY